MRLLIVTDVFPPGCGGSGWSTFHLSRALLRAGHDLRVVKPAAGLTGVTRRTVEGIEVVELGYRPTPLPFVRGLQREESLRKRLARYLADELRSRPVDLIHAQHAVSGLAAVSAPGPRRVPVVVTVRDYWPICYFTTWTVAGERCPDCSFGTMLECMREKAPRSWWAGIPLMPAMRERVRRRQEGLRRADAVIAVSRYVADTVVRPLVGETRTHVIPNTIDVEEVQRSLAAPSRPDLPERFVLFAGKLNLLKGAGFVLEVAAMLRGRVPLVIAGDGTERAALVRRAHDERLDVRFLPWIDNAELLRAMHRSLAVLVPSRWAEPLSRTVLEAMAVGVPVLATDTGGIHDQLEHERTGLILPAEPAAFAAAIGSLLDDLPKRARIGKAARQVARERFDPAAVLPRIEALYQEVVRKVADSMARTSSGG